MKLQESLARIHPFTFEYVLLPVCKDTKNVTDSVHRIFLLTLKTIKVILYLYRYLKYVAHSQISPKNISAISYDDDDVTATDETQT
jgi:hypothetical protein